MKTRLCLILIVTILLVTVNHYYANAQWNFNGSSIYNTNSGNVGVGTTTPGYKLDVVGRMRIRRGGDNSAGAWFTNAANNTDVAFVGMANDNNVGFWGNTGFGWGLTMNTTNGNVGLGTLSPGYKLDVVGRMRIRRGGDNSAGAWFTNAANNTDVAFVGMANDNNVGFWGNTGFGWGLTMNTTNGNVGLGTLSPGYKLDVVGRMRIRRGGDNSAGAWFTNAANNTDVAFVGMADDNNVGFWGNTGFGWGLTMNTTNGNVGLGTLSPGYKLDIAGRMRLRRGASDPSAGAWFMNAANTADAAFSGMANDNSVGFWGNSGAGWGFIMNTVNGNVGIGTVTPSFQLQLSRNSAAKPGSAFWTVIAGLQSKENVSDFTDGLNIITKIHPVWYDNMSEAGVQANKRSVGTIAQELQKVAPYMVKELQDQKDENSSKANYLGIDYSALLFMFVNAFKEQQQEIDKLKEQVNQLLGSKAVTENAASAKSLNIALSNALEQNFPNPFKQSTTISYTLPKQFTNAQIVITDQKGIVLKTINVTGTGKGILNLDAATLSSGTYSYSLMIDGKMINAKQMIKAK